MAVTDRPTTSAREDLADVVARALGGGKGKRPPQVCADLETYFSRYFAHLAPEDFDARTDVDLYGMAMSQLSLARVRPQGSAVVKVFTPSVDANGWVAEGHTVVEVISRDMAFLVDSVTMTLNGAGHSVHLVVHPQLWVRRDAAGELLEVCPAEAGGDGEAASGGQGERIRESWMHIEIDRETNSADLESIETSLREVLGDVREAVEDWAKMRSQVTDVIDGLEHNPPPLDDEEIQGGRDLLEWLAADHFTFLGYREYKLSPADAEQTTLTAVPGTGLGILRSDERAGDDGKLPQLVAEKSRERGLMVIAKANSKATVHRPVYLDYLGIKVFDDQGEVCGERRFLGLFSSAAYTESLLRIPVVRDKAVAVIEAAGATAESHTGKAYLDILEGFPRDELFQTSIEDLIPIARAVLHTRERRQLRLFVRADTYQRYLSALVYLPRDRYNTGVREKLSAILLRELGGETIDFTARVSEALLARLHFVVRPAEGQVVDVDVDVADVEKRLAAATRSWSDDFAAAVRDEYGEERGATLAKRYGAAFPEAYKEDYPARSGAIDVGRLEAIEGEEGLALSFYQPVDASPGEARLKVFRIGPQLSLSAVLPMLSSMGVEVVDERPYELDGVSRPSTIYDFGLRSAKPIPSQGRELFQDAVRAIWDGASEADGFNSLILLAGLTWRQVSVLRAYARYMRQGGSLFTSDSLQEALANNLDITALLVRGFETRFDPEFSDDRDAASKQISDKITTALDQVSSLDHDRILRSYATMISATLRTNYFQIDADGAPKPYMSFKLEPRSIPDLPEPRPRFEIFVYSPRVEGVHLRFGAVARGGLRWSDRRDDYRTEVLGLVKAQMVKNAVIVPVGAKGGFYCKNLPDSGERDAWLAEGKACYRTFISGLLDITDNLVDGSVVPPKQVVRHDGDDAYLVVAADKGTATFSDLANSVSTEYGFWLGDAFASGGSVGYDHKAMGITARGAWVSVQRHFRERGIDCQNEDFTCVGIGDMSGDVFGNGMLLSEHIRLVAAFDHRDIFLDPDPDAAQSFAERTRLFALPRSSWADYDNSLISDGGGIYSRRAKSISISKAVRAALGLADAVETLTPNELIRAILLAPVDLLWNGGIGTYVKSAVESHADVGDKANDPIRVNGADLRCAAVGEGGNLGLTQLGRIEYAREGYRGEGGAINTDAIDNSAGVDTSDHEVNIKILLDRAVDSGDLTTKQRNEFLATMTDEVGALVLEDNYEQNIALASSAMQAPSLLHVHAEWMDRLEKDGQLDRALEFLPNAEAIAARHEAGLGLTVPELAVLLSYTKIVLAEELIDTDLPDDEYLRVDLLEYFPTPMRKKYADQIENHPLSRQIVVTQVVNAFVNGAGITFYPRLSLETGASTEELVRANFVARDIFGSRAFVDSIYALDNELPAAAQLKMRVEMRTLVERASRWLINNRRPPLDSKATVEAFAPAVAELLPALPELLVGTECEIFTARKEKFEAKGVPSELASATAALSPAYALMTIVDTATRLERDPLEVGRVHFAVGESLGLGAVTARILDLPREDRWQTMARAALRDDLHAVHGQLTAQVFKQDGSADGEDLSASDLVDRWEAADELLVSRAKEVLVEIVGEETADLARMSVGLRVVRTLLATP